MQHCQVKQGYQMSKFPTGYMYSTMFNYKKLVCFSLKDALAWSLKEQDCHLKWRLGKVKTEDSSFQVVGKMEHWQNDAEPQYQTKNWE